MLMVVVTGGESAPCSPLQYTFPGWGNRFQSQAGDSITQLPLNTVFSQTTAKTSLILAVP